MHEFLHDTDLGHELKSASAEEILYLVRQFRSQVPNREKVASGIDWLNREAGVEQAASGLRIELEHLCSGEAFLTPVGPFVQAVQDAVQAETGRRPEASTTGGTSDARFIRALCPVLELGLVGQTMHQIDERVPTAELLELTDIYRRVIETAPSRLGVLGG